jgi:enediyne biosynthesis protein E4
MAGRHGGVKGVCDPCALIPRSITQGASGRCHGPVSTTTRARGVPRSGRLAVALMLVALVAAGLLVVRALSPAGSVSSRPPVALDPPHLIEVAREAGIEHTYAGDHPYVVGGGVAAFDCDDDGWTDLYLAGGEGTAALYRNRSDLGGSLRFEAVRAPATDLTSVTGAYPVDIDGDGHIDLAVLRLGEDVILRGLGGCRFERANESLAIDGGSGWTVGFSATWETPSAALPTLAFGDYLTLDDQGEPTTDCADDRLVRPATSGTTFTAPVALAPSWCTLSMLFSDWDRSGRRDLRVSNDRHYYRDGEEQLWRIEAGQAPRLYTRDDGWAPLQIWGMGIASQDVTGDAYPEVYLTSQGDNKLQTLADGPAEPRYEDIALRRGVTAHKPYTGGDALASTAWHPAFEDVNNDGFMDLYVSKGNVETQDEYAAKDPSNLLIGQTDGTFIEGAMAAGIVGFDRVRGAALVDLNRDGLLELVQVARRENVKLWRNVGSGDRTTPRPMGRWIAVDLQQDAPNGDAIGSWITVRIGNTQLEREVTIGGGHASGQLVPIHFGLGVAERADVRVTWPDGEVGPWLPVDGDRVVRIVRGATAAQPASP